MAEWAFDIATNEYACPRCEADRGVPCRSPRGRLARMPHGDRVAQLTSADWEKCRGRAVSLDSILAEQSGRMRGGGDQVG